MLCISEFLEFDNATLRTYYDLKYQAWQKI